MVNQRPFAEAHAALTGQQGPGAGNILDDPRLRARLAEAIAHQPRPGLHWPEPDITGGDVFYTDGGHAE